MRSRGARAFRTAIFVLGGWLALASTAAAWLDVSIAVSPDPAAPGDEITVTMHVFNWGMNPVDSLIYSLDFMSNGGGADYSSGPNPPALATIASLSGVDITWKYRVTGKGKGYLYGTISGYDNIAMTPEYGSDFMEVEFFSPLSKKVSKNDLLVAPNVWNLSNPASRPHFVVRGRSNEKVELRIFDAAGRLVDRDDFTLDADGFGDMTYSGINGKHLSPGIYWVQAVGKNFTARKPFKVITEKK